MADIKISELPAHVGALDGVDFLPMVDDGLTTTEKVTVAQIASYMETGLGDVTVETLTATDATEATSPTSAPLKVSGGFGVAKKSFFGDDIDIDGNLVTSGLIDGIDVNTDVTANNAKISYDDAAAVALNTAKNSYPSGDATKVDFITVTQAVDLDTMESDIATNNAKISYDDAAAVALNTAKISYDDAAAVALNTAKISYDDAAAVALNTAKTTNATHTSEVTGATALTVDKVAITNKGLVTAVTGDMILISDTSDGGNLKRVDAGDFFSGIAPVDSVNGQTGVVVLDTDDIAEGVNKYNVTHTGEVTGATALTVDETMITNKGGVTPVGADTLLIIDGSDSDTFKQVTAISIADLAEGRLLSQQTFDASGTWTRPAGVNTIRVTVTGGGGGGGGGEQFEAGAGGGSAATTIAIFDSSAMTTQTIVIGAGGAGGTATASTSNPGGAGSDTSFGGTLVIAAKGNGGNASDGDEIVKGGAAGFAAQGSTTDPDAIELNGSVGGMGFASTASNVRERGTGAASYWDGRYGSGGNGGRGSSSDGAAGTSGANGFVLVEEYS